MFITIITIMKFENNMIVTHGERKNHESPVIRFSPLLVQLARYAKFNLVSDHDMFKLIMIMMMRRKRRRQ